MNEISLENMNCHMQDNIKALVRFWSALRCEKFPKVAEDKTTIFYKKNPKYDPEKYKELTDGLEAAHGILIRSNSEFWTDKTAAIHCYNILVGERRFAGRSEKAGFDAAKIIFEKRLK